MSEKIGRVLGALGEESSEDEFGAEDLKQLSVVIGVIILLIILTIAFEFGKEHVEHHASHNMRPIIEKLFGEMTVLGFLSLFTYCFTKTGVFENLSDQLFSHDSEELLEIFEEVHFAIFFIMIFFVVQVLVLVREGMQTEEMWNEMDQYIQNEQEQNSESWRQHAIDYSRQRAKEKSCTRTIKLYFRLLFCCRDSKANYRNELLIFKALRDEFILDRSLEPPFHPKMESNRVPLDFDFGRYLSVCLANELAHVVEVQNTTWFILAIGALVYYIFCIIVDNDFEILAWTWVVFEWLTFFFNVYFERHLLKVRNAFCHKAIEHLETTNGDQNGEVVGEVVGDFPGIEQTESDQLLTEASRLSYLGQHELLPKWCRVDLDAYLESRRPFIARALVGGIPNRQQSLYWFDRHGPKYYLLFLQLNLIFVGVSCAAHLMVFAKYFYYEHSYLRFSVYAIMATLPVLGIILNKKHLVSTLSQVCCLGTYRRPQVITSVLREEKTAQIVRAFMALYNLRRIAHTFDNNRNGVDNGEHDDEQDVSYTEQFTKLEIKDIGRTFDSLDEDGSGSICVEELEDLMQSMGSPLPPVLLQKIVATLDRDQDGQISREEFLQWYADTARKNDHMSLEERARFLFEMLDSNKSGEITIGEFKNKLDAIRVGFSIDEIGLIVNELDHDNSGTIGLEEFQKLLHHYYPKEFLSSANRGHHGR